MPFAARAGPEPAEVAREGTMTRDMECNGKSGSWVPFHPAWNFGGTLYKPISPPGKSSAWLFK